MGLTTMVTLDDGCGCRGGSGTRVLPRGRGCDPGMEFKSQGGSFQVEK